MKSIFDDFMYPIINQKYCFLYDNYRMSANQQWYMWLLIAAADLKKQGREYKNPRKTLEHSFELLFAKKTFDIGDRGNELVDKVKFKKSNEYSFVKKYLLKQPEIYFRDIINATVSYERIYEISLKYKAWQIAKVTLEISENDIDEMIRKNYTDLNHWSFPN